MTHGSTLRGQVLRRGAHYALTMLLPLLGAAPSISHAAGDAAKPVASPGSAIVTYVTQPGDSLYAVAARYLVDPRDWTVLRRMNHVQDPSHLRPGLTLRMPVALLQRDHLSARVVAMSGQVEHAFRGGPLLPVSMGATLSEGDRLCTRENAFVTLELADGSHISLSPGTSIDLGILRKTGLTGVTDRVIDLQRGEVASEVTHATKPDDRFQIRSPSVVAGVRGTQFRVNYLPDGAATTVEVLDGTVGVDAVAASQSALQLVQARFGSVTRGVSPAGAPVELLPAPSLVDPARLQDGQDVSFDLAPLAQASAYRVQIARDAGMLDMIRDIHAGQPHAVFGDLADGTYFVRVSGVDTLGLEGLPRVYAFERRQFGLAVSAVPRQGSRDYEFRWLVSRPDVATRFRFVLANTADLRNPIVDKTDITAGQIVVTALPSGDYYWTVIAEQFDNGRFYEKGSPIRTFTLAY
jgi:hypothetical protein